MTDTETVTGFEPLRAFTNHLTDYLNGRQIMPRRCWYLDHVILALLSKSLTVSDAILCLLKNGFYDEAFGMSRTMEDIFYTVRYISNSDSESRARRYAQFFGKAREQWMKLVRDYYPQSTYQTSPEHEKLMRLARNYSSPHRWAGNNLTAKDFASEADSFETDETGKPIDFSFDYRAIYQWTSHYVHPTVVCLDDHCVDDTGVFRVHSGGNSSRSAHLAIFNTAFCLKLTFLYAFRSMNMTLPDEITNEADGLLLPLQGEQLKGQPKLDKEETQ